MAMFTCSECGVVKSQGYVRKCNKCKRILCDTCKGAHSACNETRRAKSKCAGTFLRPSVFQVLQREYTAAESR